jgi:hypothetical protein
MSRWLLICALPLLLAGPAYAEITSFSGFASAMVQEFINDDAGDLDEASDAFPGTSSELPLQVIAQLVAIEEDAAASAAAQFADPTTVTAPNPEEFALNLALLSDAPDVRYTSEATSQEVREIVFTQAEFPRRESGESIELIGRFYLDGALVIFSPQTGVDLAGAEVIIKVTVTLSSSSQETQTVFEGTVGLTGNSAGGADRVATGDIPTLTLIQTNLAAFVDEYELFETLIIPRLSMNYTYNAVIDEPLTLTGSVSIDAANLAGQVGVAAVVGAPLDTVQQVIAAVDGAEVAGKFVTALQQERENPTGEPAFPSPTAQPIMLPFCGLFGFEVFLGGAALIGLRTYRPCWGRKGRR